MEGHTYIDRTDWLDHILSIHEPRVVVLEDMDGPHRLDAFVGEMHANILRTLGCVGVVTNGAVRGIPTSRAIGSQMFAGNLCVSHAYAHVIDLRNFWTREIATELQGIKKLIAKDHEV
jgi:regulator of RNase E activity RraA